jgi:hypothetical protein
MGNYFIRAFKPNSFIILAMGKVNTQPETAMSFLSSQREIHDTPTIDYSNFEL